MRRMVWLPVLAALILLGACSSKPEAELPTIQYVPTTAIAPTRDIKVTTTEPDPDGVTLGGVGFGMENLYIAVTYKAPPDIAKNWQPLAGDVYVMDEKTGIIYRDVPSAPIIGPLFQRPKTKDQAVAVMLLNTGYAIKSGSVLTVVLGNYKREHYVVP